MKLSGYFLLPGVAAGLLATAAAAQVPGGVFKVVPQTNAEGPVAPGAAQGGGDRAVPIAPSPGEDQHSGYYYPEVTSQEVYGARAQPLKEASRGSRIGFVTGLTQQQLGKPYTPPFAVFAKGGQADKMIIVSLGDHGFRTIYQARGLLAQLTAVARSTSMFRELQVEENFTFFDLAKMLGFAQITVSDGETFSHQILLQ